MTANMHRPKGLLMLGFLSAVTICGCSPESTVPVHTVKTASQTEARRTLIDRSALEIAEGNWRPVQSWDQVIIVRNPFRGFSDIMMAEIIQKSRLKDEDSIVGPQLQEQLYNSRDYRLIGVITGTAEPKAIVTDPAGNRFILRRGSLIGNNHGSVSSIRRDRIEIFEMISGEGQYIELPLHDKPTSDIQLTLQ
ncbi:MAG: pilus assembly protein PilP [Proteobacteria bacterium]|nr:pilus assembly protein PilP [Pseudomonadota bacterium]